MAQGHVVKVGKNGGIHIIRPAHRNFFGLRALGAGDELVGQQDISGIFIQRKPGDRHAQRIGIAFDFFPRKRRTHVCGFYKGQ